MTHMDGTQTTWGTERGPGWRRLALPVLLGLAVTCLLALALVLVGARPAKADGASIQVTTTDDELNGDADCSLREAIEAANQDAIVSGCAAGSGADTIVLPQGTYTLTVTGDVWEDSNQVGDLDITSTVTISGAGMATTFVDASGLTQGHRVFDVRGGAVVTITGLTVQSATLTGYAGSVYVATDGRLRMEACTIRNNLSTGSNGAGMYNQGKVVVAGCVFTNNATAGSGGGIYNNNWLTVTNSTVANNASAGAFGGSGVAGNGLTVLVNSTVVGNSATGHGGGISNISGPMYLTNCTVSGNVAGEDGGGIWMDGAVLSMTNVSVVTNTSLITGTGGGIVVADGVAYALNTLSAKNGDVSAGTAHPDCYGEIGGPGYNVVENATGCVLGGSENITGSDPRVALLADNGGDTWTHALKIGSPAIGAGRDAGCPAKDQRGEPRLDCDIGAYESQEDVLKVYAPLVLRNA
jgi:CSLREA domain-containing protein